MISAYKYKLELISNNVGYTKGDSAGMAFLGTDLYRGPAWSGGNFSSVWKSSVSTYDSFTQLADFPGSSRHWYGMYTVGSYIYVFCGEGLADLWRFDGVNWLQITLTGVTINNPPYIPFTCTDGTHLYLGGGQSNYDSVTTTPYNKFYRITTAGVVTALADIPFNWTSGCAAFYSDGKIRIAGGGGLINNPANNPNIYEYNIATNAWSQIGVLIPELRATYLTGFRWDNKDFICSMNSDNGLYYSGDFINYLKYPASPVGNHASRAIELPDGSCGFYPGHSGVIEDTFNSMYKLSKISY